MTRLISRVLMALLLLSFTAATSLAQVTMASPDAPYQLAGNGNQVWIDRHGACKWITNLWEQPAMIPIAASQEWYNTNTTNDFLQQNRRLLPDEPCTEGQTPCGTPLDEVCPPNFGEEHTLVTILLDGSGSMDGWENVGRLAVNKFLRELRNRANEDGNWQLRVSQYYFTNGGWNIRYNNVDARSTADWANYPTAGGTPLYATTRHAAQWADCHLDTRPGWRHVFIVMTDGMSSEASSPIGGYNKPCTGEAQSTATVTNVYNIITNRRSRATNPWQVFYIGAMNGANNTVADHEAQANAMGFPDSNIAAFSGTGSSYEDLFEAVAHNAVLYANGSRRTINLFLSQRCALRNSIPNPPANCPP